MLGKMTMKRAIIGIALALGSGFVATDSWAAGAVARAQMKGSFARIMISGDQPVRFQSERQGNKLLLRFANPGAVDLSSITSALSPYVTSASMSGSTATLTLNGPYNTRQFISGNASGIDLMDLNAKAPQPPGATAKAAAPAPVPTQQAAATPVPAPTPPLTMVRQAAMPWQGKQEPTSAEQTKTAAPEPVKEAEAKTEAKMASVPAAPDTEIAAAKPVTPAPVVAAKPGTFPAPTKTFEAKPYTPSAPLASGAKDAAKAPTAEKPSPLAKIAPSGSVETTAKAEKEILSPQAKQTVDTKTFTPAPVSKPTETFKAVAKQPEKQVAAIQKPVEKIIEVKEPAVKADVAKEKLAKEKAAKEAAEKAKRAADEKAKEEKLAARKANAEKAKAAEEAEEVARAEKEKADQAAKEKATTEAKIAAAAVAKEVARDDAKDDEDDEEGEEEKEPNTKRVEGEIPDKPINPVTGGQAGDLVVTVDSRKIAAEFYFPWKQRVASAAFFRGDDFYLVFNKEARIDTEMLKTILPNFIESVVQMPAPGQTVLRMKGNTKLNARMRKEKDSYTWIVGLSRRSSLPNDPIVVETISEPGRKPNIFLPVLETAKYTEIKNPDNDETLVVVPVYNDSVGVFPERSFVDASFPRTAQGVAIVKKNPMLRVSRTMNGLRISTPQGLLLSKDLPKINLQEYIALEDNSLTFLPYSLWKTEDNAAFTQRRQQLLKQITEATDEKASYYRLNLAQLYLGAGLNHEALAILNLIHETDPDFYESYQLAALHGAANFMSERYSDAAMDFADSSLEGEDEVEFWKSATALMLGTSNKSIRYPANEKQYVRNYPPEMRTKFAIIAADQMLTKKRYNTALRFLNMLAEDKLLGPVKDYADALIGRIYFDMNNYANARKTFEPLVANTKSRFVRSTAEFYMASIDFQENKIDRKELIKRLDRLRMVWRGDALEPTVLNALGDLYVQENDYISALRAWRELVRHYPDNPSAQDVYARMSTTFVQLFDKGKADDLPPIEALAIYYEFRDLTPVDATGDKMIQNLADRLASVDLLDRAAALLEHQVTYRLQKEDRSRVGARLAMIYLLNKEPSKAIDALERTGYGNNPPSLEQQRNQIAATAYSQTGDGQTALALVRSDKSMDAKDIRMDVYWNGKDWGNVIASGENILAARSDITAPLSLRETQTLLRLAIAYSFTRDTLQLQYLRDYFSPLIQDPQRKEAFTFITSNLEPLDNRNITQLSQQLSDVQSFIQNYRVRVNEEGLSKAVN